MTGTGPGPGPTTGSGSGPASDPGPARPQALSELRRRHPRWVVLWLARTGLYHGYPLYTQRLVSLSAGQPAELSALMDQAEQAAHLPRASRSTPVPSQDGADRSKAGSDVVFSRAR